MAVNLSASSLADHLGAAWHHPSRPAAGLAAELRAQVIDGRLAVRTRLPSERALAQVLGVSRGTVTRAYDELQRGGFLVREHGAGSWLTLPEGARPGTGLMLAIERDESLLNLAVAALPAPSELVETAAERALAHLPRHAAGLGYLPAGLPELRAAIADRYRARGLRTTAEQILVCNGAQHALSLVLALLMRPGQRAVIDQPAYPRTITALVEARCRVDALPLTPSGWDVPAWTQTIAAQRPRLAITVADFHNPTGLVMDAAARRTIAEACARAATTFVVDETNVELTLDGPPLPPPVAAHAEPGTVVTLGSLSKAAWGGLRVGWIRATPRVVNELAAVRANYDGASPVVDQLIAVEVLRDLDAITAGRRALLRTRRDALLAAAAGHAPDWRCRRPHGGLCAWFDLGAPISSALCAAAAGHGIHVVAGGAFAADATAERFLRIPFVAAEAELADAVATLARLAEGVGGGGGPRRPGDVALGTV